MGWQAWVSSGAVLGVLAALVFTRVGPELVLAGALAVLLLLGVADAPALLAGFSNQGMLTVAALFVVAAGVRETGGVWILAQKLLGAGKSLRVAQARLMFPVAAISGFMNNTPLVAMLVPIVTDWSRRRGIPASKLLMLLSYAAILGGMCTLLGTSTNLLVHGLYLEETGTSLGLFSITPVGLPVAIIALVFLVVVAKWLLPARASFSDTPGDAREYVLEMVVEPGSPLVGQRIEAAGLRHLPGLFLAEIERGEEVLAAVGPQEVLQANDRLGFVGAIDSVVDLQKIRGLVPATNQRHKLADVDAQRELYEAVVAHTSPLIGKTIREGRFRNVYNAAVLAVSRNGERLRQKIGDIALRPGDTLLIEAHPSFHERHRNSPDFYMIGRIEGYTPPRHDRAWVALAILGAMVVLAATEVLSMLQASFAAAGAMLLFRCLGSEAAGRSIDFKVLVCIASAIGIAAALQQSGAAAVIAGTAFGFAGSNPALLLVSVYLITLVFTEIITNNAAAVLVFPLALEASRATGAPLEPLVMAIMVAASASFATPLGYQTNLMVYGPGGYRFTDFLRIGIPLDILVAASAIGVLLWIY